MKQFDTKLVLAAVLLMSVTHINGAETKTEVSFLDTVIIRKENLTIRGALTSAAIGMSIGFSLAFSWACAKDFYKKKLKQR